MFWHSIEDFMQSDMKSGVFTQTLKKRNETFTVYKRSSMYGFRHYFSDSIKHQGETEAQHVNSIVYIAALVFKLVDLYDRKYA